MHALELWLTERKERGERITLRELAGKVDCSVGWLSDVINGNGVPSLKLARKLSAETGIPLDELARDA